MNLKNIITIADKDITMVITAKDGDEVKRYDFAAGKWTTNTTITPDKLITVEEFTKTNIYRNIMNNKLISWNILHIPNIHSLADCGYDVDSIYKGFVLNVSINMVNGFSREGKRYMEICKDSRKKKSATK